MNKLPIFNNPPKCADAPVEAGVTLYQPYISNVYDFENGWFCTVVTAETTDVVVSGQRMVNLKPGPTLAPDRGDWYLERWQAELAAAEILCKRKEKCMDYITEQLDRAEMERGPALK